MQKKTPGSRRLRWLSRNDQNWLRSADRAAACSRALRSLLVGPRSRQSAGPPSDEPFDLDVMSIVAGRLTEPRDEAQGHVTRMHPEPLLCISQLQHRRLHVHEHQMTYKFLINNDIMLCKYAFTYFKDILDSSILRETSGIVPGLHSMQFIDGTQAFPAPPTVIERIGILLANSERFQGNRMLEKPSGSCQGESPHSHREINTSFPLDHNGSSLGWEPHGKRCSTIGGGNIYLCKSFGGPAQYSRAHVQ